MVVVKSEIRADIVSVARKVFSRKGFRYTTMDEIARATGMGKSSIYYYYKSKEDIFEAVVVREAQELKKRLNKVVSAGDTPREQLKDYIMFRLYHVKTVTNFYSVLNDESLEQMNFVNRIRQKFEEEEFKMVREVLEKGIEDGAFVVNNADIGAMAFTTMLKGLELPLFLKRDSRIEKEKLLDDLIRVIFYGIIKRES